MRQKIAMLFALGFLLFSCSISKAVREERKTVNGTWTLENVGYEENEGSFKSILFNDAKAVCFEGSTWFFLNNNSTGNYNLKNSSICSGGQRNIRWSIVENDGGNNQLQFKFIDEKKKDIYGRTGYRFDIVSLSLSEMTLKSKVTVDGSPISVVYEFVKQ